MTDHVILFAGPMGAGKSTAIRTLSETEVVSTEAGNSERDIADKPTTTVALDYGEIRLGGDERIRLYGAPGQRRFDFMRGVLRERARGLFLLVAADGPDVLGEILSHLNEFSAIVDAGGAAIGITRTDLAPPVDLDRIADAIDDHRPGLVIPVFEADPRDETQMRTLLLTLVAGLDARAQLAAPHGALLGSPP